MMDCCLIVYQPYRPLAELFGHLKEWRGGSSPELKLLFEDAWKFVNDSLKTDMALMHPPAYVAMACLHLASIARQMDLTNWFAEVAVDWEAIQEIDRSIVAMYEMWQSFDEINEFASVIERLPRPQSESSHSGGGAQAMGTSRSSVDLSTSASHVGGGGQKGHRSGGGGGDFSPHGKRPRWY